MFRHRLHHFYSWAALHVYTMVLHTKLLGICILLHVTWELKTFSINLKTVINSFANIFNVPFAYACPKYPKTVHKYILIVYNLHFIHLKNLAFQSK